MNFNNTTVVKMTKFKQLSIKLQIILAHSQIDLSNEILQKEKAAR